MKATVKLILFLITFSFVACDKDEDDFSKKDSYLYVWNVRTWEVGKESKLCLLYTSPSPRDTR